MDTPDPYKNWLEDYNREVDDAVRETASGDYPGPTAERAVAEFENWWAGETEDIAADAEPSLESEIINKELQLSRREIRLLRDELETLRKTPDAAGRKVLEDQLRALGEERAKLQAGVASLEEEKRALEKRGASAQTRIGELRVELSRLQDEQEAKTSKLEDSIRALKEQLRAMTENKEFLQKEFARQSTRLEAFETELKAAYSERTHFDSLKGELESKIKRLEENLIESANRRSALEGSLSELRNQASELRGAVIGVPAATARAGVSPAPESPGPGLAEALEKRQSEAEDRLKETMRYLELKLREIQSENRERVGEVRELMASLARLHSGGPAR